MKLFESFISASNNFIYEVSIEGHIFEVVEFDGHSIETQFVDYITMMPGITTKVKVRYGITAENYYKFY